MKELCEKLEDKGINIGMYLIQKNFLIFVSNPVEPLRDKYYIEHNNKIIEECLIEVDYLKYK